MNSYELFISLRYLRARRKQVFVSVITFISIIGILLGVATLIIVLAVMNGFETDLRDKILGVNAHVVITEYGKALKSPEKIALAVEELEGVKEVSPFIYGQAMLRGDNQAMGVVVKGVDAKNTSQILSFGRMQAGNMSALSEERVSLHPDAEQGELPPIVLGKELAKNLYLRLHDNVSMISPMGVPSPMGLVPRVKKFRVVGIFDSGFYEYDSTLVFLSLQDAQMFFSMGNLVSGVEVALQDIYKAEQVAADIRSTLGSYYWVRTWMEMNKNLFSALTLQKRVMAIILSLIVLVAAFNIITTLIMVVMEKNKDIAVLKSMGATSKGIMKIFIFQGMTIGVIGTSLGCAIGLTLALNLSRISLFIEELWGIKFLPEDVYYLAELPSRVNYGDVCLIAAGTLLISFLSTLYPSWRASKLDPAEALRYE